MSAVLNVAFAAFAATALTLAALGAASYRRSRLPRLGLLALGFGWFALAGLAGSVWLFTREDIAALLTMHIALSSLGLLTIFFATVKRG